MAQLAGFKESGMRKIADRMGYTGPMTGFTEYLNANPDKQQMMNSYVNKAMLMASGGYVRKFQEGGFAIPEGFNREEYLTANPDVLQAISQGQFSSAEDHYRKFGGGEQRLTQLPQGFDPESYAVANPDVLRTVDINPETGGRDRAKVAEAGLKHFREFGFKEERPLGFGQETQTFVPPPTDDRDTVTTPPADTVTTPPADTVTTPPADTVTTPPTDDRDTVTTTPPADTVTTAPDPNEGLTPEQIHRRNFYASTPEEQEAINARFPFYQLPVGPTDTGAPAVDTTQPPAGTDTQPPAPPPGSVVGSTYIANRPDVAQAIAGGETFGIDPATLQGLSEEEKNQRLAQAHFNAFGNQENINPVTGLSNTPSNFDGVSDQVIIDYLDQYPDLREAFGPNNDPATLAKARAHYADFGRREIAEGGRARLVQFDLTPAQLEAFRYSNDAYENFTPTELRRTYIQIGGAEGATNFDRNAQVLNNAELAIYRDNNPDLANLSDFELRQHFIQFGRQEMLQGTRPKIDALVPPVSQYAGLTSIGDISAARMERPALASGTRVTPEGIPIREGTDIATTIGQVRGDRTASVTPATAPTGATATPQDRVGQVVDTTKTAADVRTITRDTTGRTMSLTKAKPDAAQQTTSAVTGQTAETGTGIQIDPATQVQRAAMTEAETVTPVAKASDASAFIEQIKAQTTDPSKFATVAGQLETLLTDFDASNPPSWAAGAMRAATAELARRGFGASSIAGQAIVQAAMESALPIAQADASVFAQFEAQNLSNRQQMAVFYAQQRAAFTGQEFDQAFQARVTNAARVADIADKNFNAQQQVQLENSNIVNTMNLNNLSNRQAVQMAEIAALAQLDIANLNNRQQAAVQEAQAFLQKDLTDVSNAQQTDLFNAQQRIQSMFTDAAADNARKQFNATSQNQSDQFFANLATQTSQFNDAQRNAINQFNAGQENTISRFNEELNNQRDQFNAQNRLVIDQSNAQWRRSIATADTAAINRANEINAAALLDISNTAYNDLWQYYSDAMEFAWTSAENERTRTVNLAIEQLRADNNTNIANIKNDFQSSLGFGSLIGSFLTADSSSFAGSLLKTITS